ncbi:MAG: tRNA lysidine(34) synthetase TilS, partial [Rhizobiaceae bacterium]|nr:tRNA lysidine(34) synthetase TilS [Rhizobiaceae bacterium]
DCVMLAVSGGSDSMALMQLFAGYARRAFPSLRLVAATVDHGLRKEATAEARFVADAAAQLGIEHRTLAWEGTKPATGLMEAAREARHRLLAQAAREAGSDLVLVAHTMDDQAETVAMRSMRGPGGRGSAGISDATFYDGAIWFARPLLGKRRAELREALVLGGVSWVDDPSNEDVRYERVRVRAELRDEDVEAACVAAGAAAERRAVLGEAAADLIARFASMPMPGLIRIEPAMLAAPDRNAAIYALRILLATAGGQAHLPDEARAAEAFVALAQGRARLTLSGTVAERSKSGVYLYRENRNLPARGDTFAIWDGRYRVTLPNNAGTAIGQPNRDTVETRLEGAPDDVPLRLARSAVARLPAVWRGEECLGLAGAVEGTTCEPVVSPWARYLPSFDVAPARAVSMLIGARLVSEPPFVG